MSDRIGPVSVPSALAISEEIYHLKGKSTTVLINPGGPVRTLYLECEDGEYRIRSGDIPASQMPDDAVPKNAVINGTGSLSLREGQVRTMPAPERITVRGLSNKSVLTYYYV